SGGRTTEDSYIDEQVMLELEREAFLRLIGEPKTQARMHRTVVKGKPLRNQKQGGINVKDAAIAAGARTTVADADRGALKTTRPDDLAALTIKETLKRAGNYEGNIDDVIIGCAMPEAEQGMNMARNIAGLAGLKNDVPGITVNRYCSSGLQSIAYAAERIMIGASDSIIAGGAESMSLIPMGGHVIKPNAK